MVPSPCVPIIDEPNLPSLAAEVFTTTISAPTTTPTSGGEDTDGGWELPLSAQIGLGLGVTAAIPAILGTMWAVLRWRKRCSLDALSTDNPLGSP